MKKSFLPIISILVLLPLVSCNNGGGSPASSTSLTSGDSSEVTSVDISSSVTSTEVTSEDLSSSVTSTEVSSDEITSATSEITSEVTSKEEKSYKYKHSGTDEEFFILPSDAEAKDYSYYEGFLPNTFMNMSNRRTVNVTKCLAEEYVRDNYVTVTEETIDDIYEGFNYKETSVANLIMKEKGKLVNKKVKDVEIETFITPTNYCLLVEGRQNGYEIEDGTEYTCDDYWMAIPVFVTNVEEYVYDFLEDTMDHPEDIKVFSDEEYTYIIEDKLNVDKDYCLTSEQFIVAINKDGRIEYSSSKMVSYDYGRNDFGEFDKDDKYLFTLYTTFTEYAYEEKKSATELPHYNSRPSTYRIFQGVATSTYSVVNGKIDEEVAAIDDQPDTDSGLSCGRDYDSFIIESLDFSTPIAINFVYEYIELNIDHDKLTFNYEPKSVDFTEAMYDYMNLYSLVSSGITNISLYDTPVGNKAFGCYSKDYIKDISFKIVYSKEVAEITPFII